MSLSVTLRKRLGGFECVEDFQCEEGITCLLGASGCGKSLTLKMIAGIETPDEGRIELDGRVLYDSAARINLKPQERQVGYLFQNYALFPHMTVRQNILCGLKRERNREAKETRLHEVLSLLQLEGLENHRPHQLSGGQQQRAALARILVTQPRLLLLDEPFSALDSHLRDKMQLQMKELLTQLHQNVLLVTHSRDEAYHLADRIAVMDEGKILIIKETKALFANPESRAAAMITGCKNIAPCVRIGDHEVEVPSWGVRLQTAQPVGDDVRYVGIRAHYFNPKAPSNRYPVRITGTKEEPLETILRFRYLNQDADSPDLWWRVPKDRLGAELPEALGVAPANVLGFW